MTNKSIDVSRVVTELRKRFGSAKICAEFWASTKTSCGLTSSGSTRRATSSGATRWRT